MFGQIVIGPPGSGKTSYCHKVLTTYEVLGRECIIVNLDPANDSLPYDPDVDISELITLADVMEATHLGPNGGLMYCMEYLNSNIDWLLEKLKSYKDKYILFDFPGQVELFTHHDATKNIIQTLQNHNYRLCAVQLVDSHHCTDPGKYISILILTLKMMIQLELPHVNVLSKIDLIESFGKLAFNLDFYTEVQDLEYLLHTLDTDSSTSKYKNLNKAICELVGEFSLVSFYPICIDDPETIMKALRVIDKANGYVFGGVTEGNESIFATAARELETDNIMNVAEKYLAEYKQQERDLKIIERE